jgi:heme-degrading monooxygenase HmoA
MAIKVLIKRQFKEGHLKEISRLLINTRTHAMDQSGYIASETLSDYSDPNKVVVVSMWETLEDWNNWKGSELRKGNDDQFKHLLKGQTEYEIYKLGIKFMP